MIESKLLTYDALCWNIYLPKLLATLLWVRQSHWTRRYLPGPLVHCQPGISSPLPWPPLPSPEMRLPADRGFSQISVIHDSMNKYVYIDICNFPTSSELSTLSSHYAALLFRHDKTFNGASDVQRLEQRGEGSPASMGHWPLGERRVHWSLLLQGVGVVTTSGQCGGPMERERGKPAKVAHYAV